MNEKPITQYLKIDVGCEAGAKRIEHCKNKNDCGTGTNPVTRRLENSMRHTIKPCPSRQIRVWSLRPIDQRFPPPQGLPSLESSWWNLPAEQARTQTLRSTIPCYF